MISEEIIKKVVELLVQIAKPQRIYLFGSYAREDAGKNSDLDFLVVERKLRNRRKEMVRLHDAIRPMRVPTDVLVVSKSVFNKWNAVTGTVIYEARREGRLCYEAQ